MVAQFLAFVLLAGAQQAETRPADVPVLQAKLGGMCSAAFLVTDAAGAPIYNALIHVRIRYGVMGIKRADLEVGTDSAGKARIQGLPNKARPMTYDVQEGARKATVQQNVADTCEGTFAVTLK